MPTRVPHLSFDAPLPVHPWHDPVIDALGHDPRSAYVERYWLGLLGPSTTWLLRRLAARFDHEPHGFVLDLAETASALGLGHRPGKGSAFLRAIERCCRFELARFTGDELEVRRRLPPLTRRQVERLPAALQQAHHREIETRPRHSDTERLRRRSRQLALSLVQLGEDLDATERQLHRWRFHPAMAHEAALWAWEHHHRAGAGRSDPGGDAA